VTRFELYRGEIFLLLPFILAGCSRSPDLAVRPAPQSAGDAVGLLEQLGADGQASMRVILETGKLADLRWPDFSDYRVDVKKFYDAYGYALPWVRGMQPTPQARAVITLLQAADQKGLFPDDYDGPNWAARLAKLKPAREPTESEMVRFDVALTVSAMRYISDLHIGKVNPQRLDFAVDVEARKYNLPEFLKQNVVDASDVSKALLHVEPAYPGYERTIRALQKYMELERSDVGEVLPQVEKPVTPGDSYVAAPRLARFLGLVGDLPTDSVIPPSERIYQGALVDAVRHFQRRHGLASDGQINARTLAEMNVPLSRRVRQMQLTLERWRWLPDAYNHSPIVVNIPEFRLRAYDDQFRIAVGMNVVVGKAYGHDTPVFMNEMRYVIFRPYWTVPTSIADKETIPAIEHSSAYLLQEDLEIVDSDDNVVSSDSVTSEMLQRVREGRFFIRQRPGPRNSLGLIKFVFPNEYDVYMHDTPATELFSQSRRDFSHGCIRLEKPAELAAWVLRDNPGWTPARIQVEMNGNKTERVNLVHPIPVLIVYGTVIVSEDGAVHFYDDIYGHDVALERALEQGYPYSR
jgi:L,D-transpeptidase YcbB